jgi:hypothetical protein
MTEENLVETLAALEHEQWAEGFSKPIAKEELLSPERMCRWRRFWNTPYEQLPEDVKEMDRVWARRVIGKLAERLPATQCNPSRVETSFRNMTALSFLLLTFSTAAYYIFRSTDALMAFAVTFSALIMFGVLASYSKGKRERYNEKVLFLRKFLEIDDTRNVPYVYPHPLEA